MSEFNIVSLRKSVIDLAAKCKQLRLYKEELKRRRRAGEKDPTIEHKDSESSIVLWRMYIVIEKRRTRSSCARYHQLAYAFARGRSYSKVESKVRQGNTAQAFVIAEILMEHVSGGLTGEMAARFKTVLVEQLREWLVVEKKPAELAA